MKIHEIVSFMVRHDEEGRGVTTLGQLAANLAAYPDDAPVKLNGESPTSIDSYRGYYEHLAISTSRVVAPPTRSTALRSQPSDWSDADTERVLIGSRATVADVIQALDLCIGATFMGYKGGDFTMDGGTLMFAAPWGSTGMGITGATLSAEGAVELAVTSDE